MKKIVYLTEQMYLHGGAERVLTNKTNYFLENDIAEVYIITTEQKDKPPCYKINKKVVFIDLGVNYIRNLSYFHPYNLLKLPKHFIKLNKALKRINPDCIISLSSQFDFYFLPFIKSKIPKIKEFHSSRYFRSLDRESNKSTIQKLFYKFNDYIESKYDRLILLTKDEQQHFKSKNTFVIPNALSHIPNRTSNLKNKKVISAGRIAPVKQFDKLIEAWTYVAEQYPDWTLEIYGDGPEEDVLELKKMIHTLKLDKQITLHGNTNKLEEKMLESSIYVMTSKTECFPMVLLEAMSCGLPVVSFDCPYGPKNIIMNMKNGFLIDNQDIKKLAHSLIELISDINLRKFMSLNSKQESEKYHSDQIMLFWTSISNQLIIEKGKIIY